MRSTAAVTIPEGGAEGMIVTEGGRSGGYGLVLSTGEVGFGRAKVVFLYYSTSTHDVGRA